MSLTYRIKSGPTPLVVAVCVLGLTVWGGVRFLRPSPGIAKVDGQLQPTEIEIVSKVSGRLQDIFVDRGDYLKPGQTVARIQVDVVEARQDEARANLQRASNSVKSACAQVKLRESEKVAAEAVVAERESELDSAQRRLKRSEVLAKDQITSAQELDDDRARVSHGQAAVRAAQAQVAAAQAGVEAAEAEMVNVKSAAAAAAATLARVEADRADTEVKSPRGGIVQHWQAQHGDLLAAGGKVLKLLDMSDLSVTFVLPEKTVKSVVLGSEVRVRVGVPSAPVVTAVVTSIASQPNLTWSTDDFGHHGQSSMFRVKAKIPAEAAQRQLRLAQAGVPAVVWLRLNPRASWPKELELATNQTETCVAPNR